MAKATAVKLTPSQHRVQLAEDVLQQIKAKRFIATHNTYVISVNGAWERKLNRVAKGAEFWHDPKLNNEDEGAPRTAKRFQAELAPPKKCKVCVDGALFVAALDRHDDLKLRDLEGPSSVDQEDMIPYLDRWFTTFQTRLMELAFEGTWHGTEEAESTTGYGKNGDELFGAARTWNSYYTYYANDGEGFGAEELMVKIMENVITNRGTFRPDKDKVAMSFKERLEKEDE